MRQRRDLTDYVDIHQVSDEWTTPPRAGKIKTGSGDDDVGLVIQFPLSGLEGKDEP